MPTPTNLTPHVLTTSNVMMQVYLLAAQMDSAEDEISRVKNDRHIPLARPDMLQPNWGALLDIALERGITIDQYRNILLGIIQSRMKAPSKAGLRAAVLAYAPTANIVIRDYYNDSANFVGPDPSTFFTANTVAAGNVWNSPTSIWKPGRLLEGLGFDRFGTQVQVVSIGNTAEIPLLHFVPAALEYIRPAHQLVALIYQQEIWGP